MSQSFRSRVDTWLAVILVGTPLIIMVATGLAMARSPNVGYQIWLIEGLLALTGLGLPIWIFSTTRYVVDGNALVVQCGPIRQRVELRSITDISATRSILSAPALSFDRMAITYGTHQVVVISPREKEAFLRALAEAGVKAAIPGGGGPG